MTDEEILDRWHDATVRYAVAAGKERGEALFAKIAAESAAIARFGRGSHREAYLKRRASASASEGDAPSSGQAAGRD